MRIRLAVSEAKIAEKGLNNFAFVSAILGFEVDVWSGFLLLKHTNFGSPRKNMSVALLEFNSIRI